MCLPELKLRNRTGKLRTLTDQSGTQVLNYLSVFSFTVTYNTVSEPIWSETESDQLSSM